MAIRWRAYRWGHRQRPWSRAYYRPRYYGHGWGTRGYGRRWRWANTSPVVAPLGPVPSATVAWAQQALAQIFGPVVPQDGILGPDTRGFIAHFQAQQGLPPSGDLDDATLSALQAATAPPPPVPEPPPPRVLVEPPPPPPPPAEIIAGQPPHHHRHPPPAMVVAPPGPPGIIPGPPPPHHHGHPPPGASEMGELDDSRTASREAAGRGRWIRKGERVILLGV
jgi:hypothetical protein